MPGLIGKKIGMTSIFSEEGKNIPCTILEAGPCKVTQIKTKKVDGYNAVQLGFSGQNESRVSKAALGHFKKAKSIPLRISRSPNVFLRPFTLTSEAMSYLQSEDSFKALLGH